MSSKLLHIKIQLFNIITKFFDDISILCLLLQNLHFFFFPTYDVAHFFATGTQMRKDADIQTLFGEICQDWEIFCQYYPVFRTLSSCQSRKFDIFVEISSNKILTNVAKIMRGCLQLYLRSKFLWKDVIFSHVCTGPGPSYDILRQYLMRYSKIL